jgi:hypothetical protein
MQVFTQKQSYLVPLPTFANWRFSGRIGSVLMDDRLCLLLEQGAIYPVYLEPAKNI